MSNEDTDETLTARLMRADAMLHGQIADRDRIKHDLEQALIAKDDLAHERDELAAQLGAEVARSQEWMKKTELAQKRADEAEKRIDAAMTGLYVLRRTDLTAIRDGVPRPFSVEHRKVIDRCIQALEGGA